MSSKEKKTITQKEDLSAKIMERIDTEKVTIKPRIHFVLGSVFIGVGLTILLFFAGFLVNLVIFRLRMDVPFQYLSSGPLGWQVFLRIFPWQYLLLAVLLLIGGIYLLKKYDFSYQKGYYGLIIVTIVSVITFGFLTDTIGINERLVGLKPIRPLYRQQVLDDNFVVGEIIAIEEEKIMITNPMDSEDQIEVILEEETHLPQHVLFKEGDTIRVIGIWKDGVLYAEGIFPMPKYLFPGEVQGTFQHNFRNPK